MSTVVHMLRKLIVFWDVLSSMLVYVRSRSVIIQFVSRWSETRLFVNKIIALRKEAGCFDCLLTVFDDLYTVGTLSVATVYQSSKTVKNIQTAKMTIGVPIVTCLHRVCRIHEVRVRVRVRRIHKAIIALRKQAGPAASCLTVEPSTQRTMIVNSRFRPSQSVYNSVYNSWQHRRWDGGLLG